MGGNNWYKSEEEVIGEISSITNKKDYHVIINDAIVKIVVARRLGRECLKTERDNISPDDLLSLPELSFNIISGAFVSDNLAHLA